MTNLTQTQLQTVKVIIPEEDSKVKTESQNPKEVVKEMKILTESSRF